MKIKCAFSELCIQLQPWIQICQLCLHERTLMHFLVIIVMVSVHVCEVSMWFSLLYDIS